MLSDSFNVERFHKGFTEKVLTPLKETIKEREQSKTPTSTELAVLTEALANTKNALSIITLNGFDDFDHSDEYMETYEIAAVLTLGEELTFSLEASIKRWISGDGAEIESYSLTLNDEDLEDFITHNAKTEDMLQGFIMDHYQGSNYDKSVGPISEDTLNKISELLEIQAS